jgi:PAS domain S-box-containing protein
MPSRRSKLPKAAGYVDKSWAPLDLLVLLFGIGLAWAQFPDPQPEADDPILKQLPAVVVLERIPVPVLAIAQDGTVLFANTAFSEMVGRASEEVLSLKFDEIFHLAPSTESPVSVVQALANMVVELAHQDGSSVRALMSRSALIRSDDDIALATFQDLTEQLWLDER